MEDLQRMDMKMGNLGFMLDLLGRDCGPLQFLRELTQNAIEAIAKSPDKTGRVYWGLDEYSFENWGVRKLSIIDTGIGMSAEELTNNINTLSQSGGIQNFANNFGIGAKISAVVRNPSGVIYLSWKNGKGSKIWLHKNPITGKYGLKPFDLGDG